jgi:hypothetical protein
MDAVTARIYIRIPIGTALAASMISFPLRSGLIVVTFLALSKGSLNFLANPAMS